MSGDLEISARAITELVVQLGRIAEELPLPPDCRIGPVIERSFSPAGERLEGGPGRRVCRG